MVEIQTGTTVWDIYTKICEFSINTLCFYENKTSECFMVFS